MKYSTTPESLVSPTLTLDGLDHDGYKMMSDFTGIGLAKIVYFGQHFGLRTILENPSFMGLTQDQETRCHDLRNVLLFGGDDQNGADVTSKSVRY